MDLLVTYDVETTTPDGRRRLRRVAKYMEGYGQRVQYSVFEVVCGEAAYVRMLGELSLLIDTAKDSVRIYRLPKAALDEVVELGQAAPVDHRGPLIV